MDDCIIHSPGCDKELFPFLFLLYYYPPSSLCYLLPVHNPIILSGEQDKTCSRKLPFHPHIPSFIISHSPIKSYASWKYCLMFWCGVSVAGICLYSSRDDGWLGPWQVTFSTQFAPTLSGSTASRPLPNNRWGKTSDAGCVSISFRGVSQSVVAQTVMISLLQGAQDKTIRAKQQSF